MLDLEHSAVKTTCNSRVFPSPLQSKSQASRLVSYPISNWQHMPGPNVPEIFESVEKWHVILNGFNGISEDSTFCWNASVCKASEAHHFEREFCFPTQSLPLIMPACQNRKANQTQGKLKCHQNLDHLRLPINLASKCYEASFYTKNKFWAAFFGF